MSRRERGQTPHPVDIHVGQRLRLIRQQAGFSLAGLAFRVGVAFQQLQKYESAANRISASMLFDLARALQVPVASFYEGLAEPFEPRRTDRQISARVGALLATPGGLELLDAILATPGPARRHLTGLAQAIAQHESSTDTPAVSQLGCALAVHAG